MTDRSTSTLTVFGIAAVSIATGVAIATVARNLDPLEFLALPAGLLLLGAMRRSHRAFRKRLETRQRHPLERPAVWTLAIALVFVTWNGLRATSSLDLSDPFLVLAGILGLLARRSPRPRRSVFAPPWLVFPALVILLDALINNILTNGGSSALLPGLETVVALLLAPIVIGVVAGSFGSLWLLVDCWLLSVFINSSVAASDYLLHTNIGPTITGAGPFAGRSAGLTLQPNHLAFVTVMALPVIISRLLTVRSRTLYAYYGAMGLVTVLALLSSGSRGGLAGAVVAVLATPIFQRAVRARAVTALTSAGVLFALAGSFLLTGVSFVTLQRVTGSATAQTSVIGSDQGRSQLYQAAFSEFSHHPIIGVGFAHARDAHVLYLELLASGGVVAMLAFVVVLVQSTRYGLRLSRIEELDAGRSTLAGATATSMLAWIVMGLVENQLYDRYLLVPCGFLVAVGVSLAFDRVAVARAVSREASQMPAKRVFQPSSPGLPAYAGMRPLTVASAPPGSPAYSGGAPRAQPIWGWPGATEEDRKAPRR